MNNYNDGAVVRISAEFFSISGTYADPTAVYFKVGKPELAMVEYQYGVAVEVVKQSTGIYYMDLDTTGIKGLWHYESYSTGANQAAGDEEEFFVR